jgi:type II secretion system protein G
MKKLFKSSTKGFTLIELLVVVAIISLLSSIVLASLKNARDKANASAFKQEMKQLITALELYKTDFEKYPQSTVSINTQKFTKYTNNAEMKNWINLPLLLNNYISELPKIRPASTDPNDEAYNYFSSVTFETTSVKYRCANDDPNNPPPYVIVAWPSKVITIGLALTDWQTGYYEKINNGNWTFNSGWKCFSIK